MNKPLTAGNLVMILIGFGCMALYNKVTRYDVGWTSSGHWRTGLAAEHAVKLLALRLAAEVVSAEQRREIYVRRLVNDCWNRGDQPVQGLALSVVCVKAKTVK